MDRTKIEWTDATWNPVTGCTKVSPGCDHCYAETFAERWRGTPGHPYEHGFDLTLRPERLDQPLRWTKPRRIFVNSMSDLFHADIPADYIAQVFAVMAATPRHTYQVLTKRHGRLRALLTTTAFAELVDDKLRDLMMTGHITERDCATAAAMQDGPLPNVWLGVSVEDQQRADLRIPALLDTPAAVWFLSCEPLLGPVTLRSYTRPAGSPGVCYSIDGEWWHRPGECFACRPGVGWVIVGGESGPGARPMHPAWARQLRDECVATGVPFHFKQWGEWAPAPYDAQQGSDLYLPGDGVLTRVGKRNAGRQLDGRTWDEWPATPAGTPAPERPARPRLPTTRATRRT